MQIIEKKKQTQNYNFVVLGDPSVTISFCEHFYILLLTCVNKVNFSDIFKMNLSDSSSWLPYIIPNCNKLTVGYLISLQIRINY